MSVRILIGDVREQLKTLADESVHCVVTSPPYWGLRDYGTAAWSGGDAGCDHLMPPGGGTAASGMGNYHGESLTATVERVEKRRQQFGTVCRKCGARRIDSQLGLEPTLSEHVSTMADVFDEVRRVLRSDGTLWLNYGDSYATSINGRSAADTKLLSDDDRTFRDKPFSTIGPINPQYYYCDDCNITCHISEMTSGCPKCGQTMVPTEHKPRVGKSGNKGNPGSDHSFRTTAGGVLKPKDLCGVPWRIAFALQERGWYLRQDIIWSKPNPMPESVRDRCTKAHEYVFLLTKSPRYYFDAEAIAEEGITGDLRRPYGSPGANMLDPRGKQGDGSPRDTATTTRNKRSVWEIATAPYPEAHFATFPPELPEICIKAGTSEKGCCGKCGKGWKREIEKGELRPVRGNYIGELGDDRKQDGTAEVIYKAGRSMVRTDEGWSLLKRDTKTLGWSPSCQCDVLFGTYPARLTPCTVLDPFGGAGTTGLVADRLQRNAILIELNPTYAALAEKRIRGDGGMFAKVAAE